MEKHYIEFIKNYTSDMFETNPKIFQNKDDDYAQLCLVDMVGILYYEGKLDEKPIYYIRHANPDSYRFGGMIELGDDFLSPQKRGYHEDAFIDKCKLTTEYSKLSDDPIIYGLGTKKPFSEFRFYMDHATFKESDFLNIVATPLPICIIDHGCIFPPLSMIKQPCILKGTYEGKNIIGFGSYERLYKPKKNKEDFGKSLGYIYSIGMGLREDNKYEIACASIDEKGSSIGYYWLEGEQPIVSYDVKMEANWKHLPYVDDGTCIYKDVVYRFADLEFHVEGKWGTKGFTSHPRIERHGQSQVFGTWYIGKKPYKHKLSYNVNENMEAYDYKLKKRGFNVVD